jgi:hypothetical protein
VSEIKNLETSYKQAIELLKSFDESILDVISSNELIFYAEKLYNGFYYYYYYYYY